MKIKCLFIFLLLHNISQSQISFVEKSEQLGLTYSCGTTTFGNGVSFYDVNGDGWDDLTFASSDNDEIHFFLNVNGNFEEHDLGLGVLTYQTRQINWVDFDNDGDNDLFVTSDTESVKLFENIGQLNFVDISFGAGFPDYNTFTYGSSWGDFDRDGYLDVFLSNRDETSLTSTPNMLFKNNGDGTFSDVSLEVGIVQQSKLSFCSAFIDINNDGWQDIYVSNDKGDNLNQLYLNKGDSTFLEISEESNTDLAIDAMSVTVGDYNSDGWFDLYITNTSSGNVFLRNNGNGTFTDITETTNTHFYSVGWGAVFLDGDNDKDIDLYVSGSVYENPNYLSAAFYENINSNNFQIPSNAGFDNDEGFSHSNAIGDINNDGLPDFVVTNSNDQNIALWENTNSENHNWIKINLEGTVSNRDGIGSRIEVYSSGSSIYRYTHCGEGYLSQNSGTEFFGLGNSTSIDYIKVNWLSGIEDIIFNVPANQVLTIVEGSSLSINEATMSNILVSPNPTKAKININLSDPASSITIYNALMQNVFESSTKSLNFNIDCSEFESGVYFLQVKSNKKVKTVRFIKD